MLFTVFVWFLFARHFQSVDNPTSDISIITTQPNQCAFKEPGGSLPSLHKPAIEPYLDQDLSSLQHHNPLPSKYILILPSHLLLGHPKSPFHSGFPTKIFFAFLDSSIRATCPAHLNRLDLILNYVRRIMSTPLVPWLS